MWSGSVSESDDLDPSTVLFNFGQSRTMGLGPAKIRPYLLYSTSLPYLLTASKPRVPDFYPDSSLEPGHSHSIPRLPDSSDYSQLSSRCKGTNQKGIWRRVRRYTEVEYLTIGSTELHQLQLALFVKTYALQVVFVLLDKVRVSQHELRSIFPSSVVKRVASPLHHIRSFTPGSSFSKITSGS
jgi:hypothetical protein